MSAASSGWLSTGCCELLRIELLPLPLYRREGVWGKGSDKFLPPSRITVGGAGGGYCFDSFHVTRAWVNGGADAENRCLPRRADKAQSQDGATKYESRYRGQQWLRLRQSDETCEMLAAFLEAGGIGRQGRAGGGG